MFQSFNASGDPKGAASSSRRDFLKSSMGFLLGGSAALAGCAAPMPEKEPIDPTTLIYPPPPVEPRFRYDRTIWGSNDVVEFTGTDRLRRFATGETARGKGFAKPFGVVAQDGRIFVTDTVLRYVHVYDYPRKRYYELGTRGLGRLVKPLGIAIDGAGHVYVMDGTAKRAVIYDLEGNYVNAVGGEDDLDRPSGIAVNADGSRIYVLDTGGVKSRRHRVMVYDSAGNVVQVIGERGGREGQFNLPLACTTDSNDNLYVLDTGNFRCQVFAPDGSFLRMFGEAGRFPGQFGHPRGITVDDDGIIYISDTAFGVVQLFTNEGQILMSLGRRSEQQGPGHFILPAGIGVDVDHRVYIADQFFRKVDVFRPYGLPEDTPVGQPVALDLLA